MSEYILIQDHETGRWIHAREQDLPDERVLHRLVKEHPETLPLGDLGDDVPPLLVVGREAALANGYADMVAVDQDGLVTVIEVKLDRNPEVKRTVVGQVLGYGAYLWGWSYERFEAEIVRKYLDSPQCHRADFNGVPLAEAMERFRQEQATGGEWSAEDFHTALAANLAAGRLRLMIVVDRVNDELRRTVEFLNACTGAHFEFLCAELRYFAAGATRLLVPKLIGKRLIEPPARESRRWDEAQFFLTLGQEHGLEAVQVARRLLQWTQSHADEVYWGTGKRSGSFSALVRWNPDRVVNVCSVSTYGTVEMGFQYARPYPPFNAESARRDWLARLNAIPEFRLPEDSFNRRPSIPLTALAKEPSFHQFAETMAWVIAELGKKRDLHQA